ncbi:putative F-box protein At1g58090 [Capsella rubella]|uniref:putative F-box protein At1g58090 n=1 Tax=Capsella rubella TaxID=81985 RepID=UPI000CD55F0C|nr:putative F-box protein At1g58090 [Capsella rubella]
MVVSRRLPSDVEEEILVRVPPQSLLRFRSVCKEWYNRSSSKRFVNRNFAFARPEFMLKSDSHICSVSVDLKEDPTIKVTDFCFDFLRGRRYDLSAMTCDGYMFMYESPKVGIDSGEHRGVVWNPLLRHTKYIAPNETTRTMFMGYDVQEWMMRAIILWSP